MMKKNYKKGFSLAEVLIVLLLMSIILAILAPAMTKNAKKSLDPNCPGGIKTVIAEYTVPGDYDFVAPENITGNAVITLVGAGGNGGNATVESAGLSNDITGGGGGGGGAYIKYTTSLTANKTYKVHVDAGGFDSSDYYTSFGGTVVATGGGNASYFNGGSGGACQGQPSGENNNTVAVEGQAGASGNKNVAGLGGANNVYSVVVQEEASGGMSYSPTVQGGAPGKLCFSGSCDPHGKPGSGYVQNGASNLGFIAGTGGGGGGYNGAAKAEGYGGQGGDGFARIEYKIRCR